MAKDKLLLPEELLESKRVNESKLVKGTELSETLKQEVLNSYIYRWTKENEGKARQAMGINSPKIPPISDAEWLEQHAFYVTNDGSRLDARRRHCEPAYLAEEKIDKKKINEENQPFEVDDIDPEDDIELLRGLHKEGELEIMYYNDGSDSWEKVPADDTEWDENWKFGVKKEKKLNENEQDDLREYLDDEGIYGYTDQIHAIASGDTIHDNTLDDIQEFLVENDIDPNITPEEIIPKYNIAQLLDAYLSWNGIIGYTETILSMYDVDYNITDLFENRSTNNKLPILEGLEYDTVTAYTPEEKQAKIEEIATKHGVTVEEITASMEKGREIEFEHTDNPEIADTIALHHLDEFDDYYDENVGLPNMEKELETN